MHTGLLSCSGSFWGFYFVSSPVTEATTTHLSRGSMELSLSLTLWSVPCWQQKAGIREDLWSHAPVLWPGNASPSHKEQEALPSHNLMPVCCAVDCSPVTQSRTWIIPSRMTLHVLQHQHTVHQLTDVKTSENQKHCKNDCAPYFRFKLWGVILHTQCKWKG